MAPQPAKKKSGRNLLLIAAGGLVLICGLMAYGGPQIGTEVAAEVDTPVPMPIPSEEPEPVVDSVAATLEAAANVVVPTSPPLPTALPRGYVSKATFAGDWPLTVEEGYMDCLRPKQVYFLSMDRQRVWAVNAPARSQIAEKGWSDVEDIQIPGSDLFTLIDTGLKLCPA